MFRVAETESSGKTSKEVEVPDPSDVKDAVIVEDETLEETSVDDEMKADDADDSLEGEATEDSTEEESSEDDDTAAEDTVNDDVTAAPPVEVIRETTIERRAGFFPTLIGGALAAVIGFGAARYVVPEGWPFPGTQQDEIVDTFREDTTALLESQGTQTEELAVRVDAVEGALNGLDLEPKIDAVAGNVEKLGTDFGAVQTALQDIETRLTTLEKRPVSDSVAPEAIAAYERELKALQDSVAAQRAEIEAMVTEAVQTEENAEELARLSAARAAMGNIQTALENGSPFDGDLDVLTNSSDLAVPETLTSVAASGIATLPALQEQFTPAARNALDAARADADDNSALGFLQRQLGVRSVSPREGNDPDAVLSRAEAAVKTGDLDTALSEVTALPEASLAALSDWVASASARQGAVAAAASLAQELNK